MSEQATDLKTWSRPALQRTELGPMMHDYAHRIYDMAEAAVLDNIEQYTVPHNFDDLATHTSLMGQHLRDVLIADSLSPAQQNLANYINANRDGIGSERHDLTTIAAGAVIHEGMLSGIYTPPHLYRAINLCERPGARAEDLIPKGKEQLIDASEFAERLVSTDFLRMLHELAYAPNGFLGAGSANPSALLDANVLKCFRPFIDDGLAGAFKTDEKGRVTGFADSFLLRKRAEVAEFNRSPDLEGHTGGCPVRHSTFKRLGENATAYLQGERPAKEGTSAITRAAQFVSAAMKATIVAHGQNH